MKKNIFVLEKEINERIKYMDTHLNTQEDITEVTNELIKNLLYRQDPSTRRRTVGRLKDLFG